MFRMSEDYRNSKNLTISPVIYCFITTNRNTRVYGNISPDDAEIGVSQLASCDGTVVAGDGTFLGALPIVEYEPRVVDWGPYRESLVPMQNNLLTSLQASELGSFWISLDNGDGHFSTLLGDDKDEPFLASTCELYQGFKGLAFAGFLRIIKGELTEFTLTNNNFQITIEAV